MYEKTKDEATALLKSFEKAFTTHFGFAPTDELVGDILNKKLADSIHDYTKKYLCDFGPKTIVTMNRLVNEKTVQFGKQQKKVNAVRKAKKQMKKQQSKT